MHNRPSTAQAVPRVDYCTEDKTNRFPCPGAGFEPAVVLYQQVYGGPKSGNDSRPFWTP
jgi:hypothetical protein